MTIYYLVPGEIGAYKPVSCRILKKLQSDWEQGWALAKISPPIPKIIYDSQKNISTVILREDGYSLVAPSKWPTPQASLIMYRLKNDTMPHNDYFDHKQLIFLDKVILCRSMKEARVWTREHDS